MKKKMWIFIVAFILVLLAVFVFVGVKTEFFGLLETKEEANKEEEKEEQTKKEANAYRVECASIEEGIEMRTVFGAQFLKKDKSLLAMDANVIVDFSSLEEEMPEEKIKEEMSSFEDGLGEGLGLACTSELDGKKATFQCKATKEEIVSATNADEEMLANMNYDKFIQNMEEGGATCSSKEVYVYIAETK